MDVGFETCFGRILCVILFCKSTPNIHREVMQFLTKNLVVTLSIIINLYIID